MYIGKQFWNVIHKIALNVHGDVPERFCESQFYIFDLHRPYHDRRTNVRLQMLPQFSSKRITKWPSFLLTSFPTKINSTVSCKRKNQSSAGNSLLLFLTRTPSASILSIVSTKNIQVNPRLRYLSTLENSSVWPSCC